MPPLQPVRGTSDLLGEGLRRHRHVIETARRITAAYGAGEWSTPIFEDTAVFARTLGETSDVVSKEMYSFADRGGDSLTLRPEGTAGICRALVSNGLTQSLPQRVFYAGPMFRYERPQKGRFRQFHQVGLEIIGPEEPIADAEAVACGRDLLEALGIGGQVTLEINTLGDAPSRLAYRDGLVAFFTQYRGDLSSESLARLERNPLRILDSKHEGDRRLVAQAPTIGAYLSTAAQKFYDGLRAGLEAFGVAFTENPRIVRGLDYYSHTAFEYVTDALGAQNTVLAGGRYDGLVAAMGGPPTGAVGWAAGIERLALLLTMGPPHDAPVVVVPAGNAMIQDAIPVLQTLRRAGIAAVTDYTGNLKKRMQRADRSGARLVVIVDDATRDRAVVQLKDLRNGEQTERACDGLAAAVRERTG